jgi:rhamnose utilization protein RhaD (predicted bifunctional aldolase and dehydrogenase)
VGPVKDFIADTNLVCLMGHGITALGRTISEAYHRLNSFTAEIRRNIEAERLAAIKGTVPLYRSDAEIALMHKHAEAIIYPNRAEKVMREDQAA